MTEESNAGNPMGTERVSGLVLRTGVPLLISLLINSLYNFVDSVFVSGGKRHGKRADPHRSSQLRCKKAKENLPELQMGNALFCDILQYIFPDNGGFSGMGAVIV